MTLPQIFRAVDDFKKPSGGRYLPGGLEQLFAEAYGGESSAIP